MNKLTTAIFASLTILCFVPAKSTDTRGQTVTFADFGRVNYIASSMNYVYFATTEGVLRFDKMEYVWKEPLTGSLGPFGKNVQRIWVDTFDEHIIKLTSDGLSEYNALFETWTSISEIPDLNNDAVHIQAPQILYVPPEFNYADVGLLVDRYGRQFEITDVLDDRSGSMFIATWGHGPAMAGLTSAFMEFLPYGLLQNRVNAIAYHDGLLFLGGAVVQDFRTGITRFDADYNDFSYIESGTLPEFPAIDVNCLEVTDELVLIGTPEGLYRFDRETERMLHPITGQSGLTDDNVLCLEAIGDSLFIGTEHGLSMLRLDSDSAKFLFPNKFSNDSFFDLEHVDSSLWIAGSSGAFRLKLNSGILQQFQDPSLILFGRVYDVERNRHQLWFCSDGGVVSLDLRTGKSIPYQSHFGNTNIRSLAVNDSVAAVAGDQGLTLIYHRLDPVRTRDFTVDDGLASNYIYSLFFDGDYLWIGSDRGLTRFWWNNPNRVD